MTQRQLTNLLALHQEGFIRRQRGVYFAIDRAITFQRLVRAFRFALFASEFAHLALDP